MTLRLAGRLRERTPYVGPALLIVSRECIGLALAAAGAGASVRRRIKPTQRKYTHTQNKGITYR